MKDIYIRFLHKINNFFSWSEPERAPRTEIHVRGFIYHNGQPVREVVILNNSNSGCYISANPVNIFKYQTGMLNFSFGTSPTGESLKFMKNYRVERVDGNGFAVSYVNDDDEQEQEQNNIFPRVYMKRKNGVIEDNWEWMNRYMSFNQICEIGLPTSTREYAKHLIKAGRDVAICRQFDVETGKPYYKAVLLESFQRYQLEGKMIKDESDLAILREHLKQSYERIEVLKREADTLKKKIEQYDKAYDAFENDEQPESESTPATETNPDKTETA